MENFSIGSSYTYRNTEIKMEIVSEWLLFNAKCTILQQFHGESK